MSEAAEKLPRQWKRSWTRYPGYLRRLNQQPLGCRQRVYSAARAGRGGFASIRHARRSARGSQVTVAVEDVTGTWSELVVDIATFRNQ
jgi:hypothetical protein